MGTSQKKSVTEHTSPKAIKIGGKIVQVQIGSFVCSPGVGMLQPAVVMRKKRQFPSIPPSKILLQDIIFVQWDHFSTLLEI